MGRKERRIFRGDKRKNGKIFPDVAVHNALTVREEHVGFGHSGAVTVHNGAKPTAGIIKNNLLGNKGEGQEPLSIEEKIGKLTYERLKFFDEFFNEENTLPLGRVKVYQNGYDRRYTVVKFDHGNFTEPYNYALSPQSIPLPLKDYRNGLEEYLRYLYLNGVEEVQYFEGIPDREFQTMIKALVVCEDLVAIEYNPDDSANLKETMEPVICLMDKNQKNALYWYKKDVVPVLTSEYLEALKTRYNKIMDGSINNPNLLSAYMYFEEHPNPSMKVLRLEDASIKNFIR